MRTPLPFPRLSALLFGLALSLALATAALAQSRHALVIGNDAYSEVPQLQKAVNDAIAVTDALSAQGFEVTTLTDAPRRDMNRAISQFTGRLEAGDTALVFYAGHGVEIDGENYLLPTDIVAPGSGDGEFVKSESIALSRLLDRVRATGARTTLAIIDACRENPFAEATGRSIGTARGLGRIAAPEGTFVIFSAGAGQLALDRLSEADRNSNSVFTRALLPRLSEPDLELRTMIAEVRRDVRDLAAGVGHQQFPAYYDELLGEFYMVPAGQSAGAPEADDTIRRDFELAREIGTPEALEAFVARYENRDDDFTVSLARQMLAATAAAAPAPEPEPQAAPEPEPQAEPEALAAAAPEPEGMRDVPQGTDEAAPPPEADAVALMRETQRELNRLGCDAGPPDGVAGPRTRAAYGRYLSEVGQRVGLGSGDFGTAKALGIMRSWKNPVCRSGGGRTLDGTWTYTAKCPLFITVNGRMRLWTDGARYRGSIADSLGQSGRTTVWREGRALRGETDWGSTVERWTATLSEDWTSYRGRSQTSNCSFTAWRG